MAKLIVPPPRRGRGFASLRAEAPTITTFVVLVVFSATILLIAALVTGELPLAQ